MHSAIVVITAWAVYATITAALYRRKLHHMTILAGRLAANQRIIVMVDDLPCEVKRERSESLN